MDVVLMILAALLAVVLVVGIYLYWQMIHAPWDEWDEDD